MLGDATYKGMYFQVIKEPKNGAYDTSFALLLELSFKEWPIASLQPLNWKDPNTLALSRLIDEGRLPSRIDEHRNQILGPLSPEHYELIFSISKLGSFAVEPSRLFFTKLPSYLDPCKMDAARRVRE